MKHLFRQADRYGRLARELDGRGDRTFLRSMAAGYREQAERAASAIKRH
ncbi:MAG: hypothetical protein PGN16_17695 [Sphingomonas phyllosphaerae]